MHFIKFLHTDVIATVFSSACRIEVPNFSLYKPESLWHSVISELSDQQVVVLCDFAIFTKLPGHFLIPLVRMRKGKFAACHVYSVWLRSAGDILHLHHTGSPDLQLLVIYIVLRPTLFVELGGTGLYTTLWAEGGGVTLIVMWHHKTAVVHFKLFHIKIWNIA